MKLVLIILGILISNMTQAKHEKFYQIDSAKIYKQDSFNLKNTELNYEYEIATHLWSNSNSKLILMAHGFTDSCGFTKPIQKHFLELGYDVLCLELPGHGLSSGMTANIKTFYAYQDLIQTYLENNQFDHYQEVNFFGHSTGNFGMMMMLLNGDKHPFNKIVMAAPLIKSYLWNLSRIGIRLFGKIIRRLPRRNQSRNHPLYKEIAQYDPRPIRSIPVNWPMQLMNWNNQYIYGSLSSDEKIHVLFGTADTVINYPYNRRFIEDHFKNASIEIINGSDHAFHFETPEITQKFYQYLDSIFKVNN